MKRTAVLNVVGLTRSLIGRHTPNLAALLATGSTATIQPALPAVTCTAQSNYLTGKLPRHHGAVANGWFDRDLAEVHFWKQSNRLVQAEKIWDELKKDQPGFTCANLFWWYNMGSTVDYSITPRPMYPADGRKFFDIYSWPYSIRPEIKKELGEFPFAGFWGPAAGVKSPQGTPDCVSRWIAESARWIEKKFEPTLSLVYLPHLDYNLQRFGPLDPRTAQDLHTIDAIAGSLLQFYQQRQVATIVLSEYGITPVNQVIHLNRIFRARGWITIKEELGRELLDYGASPVFAVADHQIAHVYVRKPELLPEVQELLRAQPGIASVLARKEQAEHGLDHPRSGDLIAVAKENAWFSYYYWIDDARAPDFARTVDIHRKPGYDPVELFLDPNIGAVKLKIAWRLLQKKLGFRMLMDVIPLDATLVKGSHGARPRNPQDWPLLIAPPALRCNGKTIDSTDVYSIIKNLVLGG